MELRHLRYFVAVAQEENVSRAALKLHISQPALSRQMRDLEEDLGVILLERTAKSVRLSEAGRAFLPEAKAILERAEEGRKAVRDFAGAAGLNIGYAPTLTVRFLPPALRAFQKERPSVRVKLHDLSSEEMLAGLRAGKLQLALMVRPRAARLRGLRFEGLVRDRMCLAVALNDPLAKQEAAKLEALVSQPLVGYSREDYPEYHELVKAIFSKSRLKPHFVVEHDSVSSLITAVEAGVGVALVPESLNCLAGPRLRLMPITPTPAALIVGAAWVQGGLGAEPARFLALARRAAAP
jgi:DNA-binding transcriptional LysR family regulator